MLRAAYRPVLVEPLPANLLALVEAAPVRAGPMQPPPVAVNDNAAGTGFRAWGAMHAFTRIAAALVLLLSGAAGGWFAAGRHGAQITAAAPMDAVVETAASVLVQRTLENIVSGASDIWRDPRTGDTLSVTPVRTFKDSVDRYCREYRETLTRDGERTLLRLGVACRDPGGRWNARFHVVPGADPPEELAH
jgi:surface antigen